MFVGVMPLLGWLIVIGLPARAGGAGAGQPGPRPPKSALRRIACATGVCAVLSCVGVVTYENWKSFDARVKARTLIEPLERYNELHGRYPEELAELEEARELPAEQLRRIRYELHDEASEFFISIRVPPNHEWDTYDSRAGRWQNR